MLMNVFIRVSTDQVKLKFWPILFKSLNEIMLMAIHFVLKAVSRMEKQICLGKFAIQLFCVDLRMFLDQYFLSVSLGTQGL